MLTRIRFSLVVLLGAVAAACGSNECRLADPKSCPSEMVCEKVRGREKPMCFPPVLVEGKVFDLASAKGLEKAVVTALDANGAPVGALAVSGSGGAYSLRLPLVRTEHIEMSTGKDFPWQKLTLRASAQGYANFPSGLRVSLPLDTMDARRDDKAYVIKSPLTDLGLISLPDAEKGRPSIIGTVEISPTQRGVLVVAEAAGAASLSAVADSSGSFQIFNVAPGSYTVQAYGRGANYTAVSVTVQPGADSTGVQLKKSSSRTATVNGSVQLVAGASNAGTSVVMVVESTFNANLVRGEVPPGLRAPEPGVSPNLTGSFSIDGVPDGKYVVLAAFENDGNVRDPDPKIAGTQIQHITVQGGTSTVSAFKVTGAITMVGPGAGEAPEEVSSTPSFSWKPYPSAQRYELVVFDSFGNKLWDRLALLDVGDLATHIVVPYAGPALSPGKVYQWRALARGNLQNPISLTEDLRGVFLVK